MDKIIIEPITSMKNAFSVAGQNVVITGGNRGLGHHQHRCVLHPVS